MCRSHDFGHFFIIIRHSNSISQFLLHYQTNPHPIQKQPSLKMQNQPFASKNAIEYGHKLGIALTTKHPNETIEQHLTNVLSSFNHLDTTLAQLLVSFPHFHTMMLHLLRNKLVDICGQGQGRAKLKGILTNFLIKFKHRFLSEVDNKVDVEPPALSQDNSNTNDEISASDATRIGKNFAMLLLTTTEPSAAVDSWLKNNKELKEFVADRNWFEPMMNTIAKKLLKSSNFGLKWRVGLGAGLSIG